MSKASKGGGSAAAAKFAPFDDSKLKPIHTAIDAGNYKNATKLLTAALQKHGPLPVLKILLALCHVQPGGAGQKEAHDLIRSLPPLAELDSTTFNTLLHYYKCMEDVPALIRCHEHVVSRDPKNEDENLRLFFAVLRTHDYARLQTLSMKLFTSFKQDRYLCWSAVNLLLMRRNTPPNVVPAAASSSAAAAPASAAAASSAVPAPVPGSDKMMVLLEMMLSRTYGAPSFARSMLPEELLVLVRVYSRQLKFTEALRLMDSEAGMAFKLKDATEYLRIRAQLLRDASDIDSASPVAVQRLAESNAVYEQLIAEHNDDWFFITQLIEGELKLGRTQQLQSAAPSTDASTAAASSADATVPAVPHLSFEERSTKLRTFLRELQAKVTRSPSSAAASSAASTAAGQAFKRGPYLAEAELEFQLWRPAVPSKDAAVTAVAPASSSSAASTAALEQSIVSYFRQFGSKSCFFYDVLPYLRELDHASRARIAQQCLGLIASLVGEGAASVAALADGVAALSVQSPDAAAAAAAATSPAAGESAQVKRFQLSVSVQQMFRYNYSTVDAAAARPAVSSGSPSPTPSAASRDLESLGRSMLDQFLASTKLSTTLLRIQTERGVGDPFLVLFAHAYFSYFLAQQAQAAAAGSSSGLECRQPLLDLIMVLELGLSKFSVHNYQFKLWLIRLYCHPLIGAFARARDLYRSLDIKQIQHDSLSHLLVDDALRFGHVLSDVLPSISKLLSWHATSDREDGSVTDLAYQKLNYSKVIEFVEFRERRELSFARYTAELLMPLANLAKLGVPPSALGLPAPPTSAAPDPSNSKDIANVHALLTKARADLQKKYPSITDHSVSGSLSHLVLNNDYSLVSVWDAAHTALPSMMNRPAPAVYPSSFQLPGGELLKAKDDGSYTYHASQAQQNQLRLLRLSIELLWGVTEQHAPLMRTNLHALQGVLQAMGLANLAPTADSSSAPAAAPEFSSFDDAQWRLCFLLMDCSCCVVESAAHTSSFLESPAGAASSADHADGVAQLCLRWSSVQRQFGILTFLLDSITKDISSRFYAASTQHASAAAAAAAAGASDDVRAVVYGLAAPDAADASSSVSSSSLDPRALRDIATFVQWSASWLTVAVQMWAVAVPGKKGWGKKSKHKATAAADDAADPLLECVLSVRLSLASLIKTLRASIHAMQALTNKLAARVRNAPAASSASSSTAAAATPSTLLDHKPSLLVLQSAEHSSIVSAVLGHMDSSHGHTGAQLLLLLNSLDQPLQHIKT